MRALQFTCVMVAMTVFALYQMAMERWLSAAAPHALIDAEFGELALPNSFARSATSDARSRYESLLLSHQKTAFDVPTDDGSRLEAAFNALEKERAKAAASVQDRPPDPVPAERRHPSVAYYAYAEIMPDRKPADIVLESLKGIPVGTPLEEIKRASDAFGLDFSFMQAVAKIESDFDPAQHTGSYVGLYQLSNDEFEHYGSGDVTNPRDNAIAAAYRFATEAMLFETAAHRKPSFSDLYLIHQQGWQGAAEHVSHPERIAWKSMCATDEGHQKGERWCKRAIWQNTLPDYKHICKSVDGLTSGAFVAMWEQKVAKLQKHYAEALEHATD